MKFDNGGCQHTPKLMYIFTCFYACTITVTGQFKVCSSHSSDAEESSLPGCDTVLFGVLNRYWWWGYWKESVGGQLFRRKWYALAMAIGNLAGIGVQLSYAGVKTWDCLTLKMKAPQSFRTSGTSHFIKQRHYSPSEHQEIHTS